MKRKAKSRLRQRIGEPGIPTPVLVDDEAGVSDAADNPDRSGVEEGQRIGSSASMRLAQTDMERVDERKPGSVETVPAPGKGEDERIAGFVESSGDVMGP
jgi:Ulp1 family protease